MRLYIIISVLLIACKFGYGTAIIKGPYLLKSSNHSITIKWETDSITDSKLWFGLNPAPFTDSLYDTANTRFHEINISKLKSLSKYYYAIGSKTEFLQGDSLNYFISSPDISITQKYRFWITGDCGNNSLNQYQVLNAFKSYYVTHPFHGWLLLGDNAYYNGTDAEYNTNFFQIYQQDVMKSIPLWPAPGNHDYANDPTLQNTKVMPYTQIFNTPANGECGGIASNNKTYYSFDYDNIHFLSLDSYGNDSNQYRLYDTMGPQVQWIKKDLSANKKMWTIAYWHHPPFTMGSHNSDLETELVLMRQNFVQILERYGVDFIFCGHSHSYERSKLQYGYYGAETDFDSIKHVKSSSSGMYNGSPNSCAYVKNKSNPLGTVYVVAGSAGSLGGAQLTYPHDAMYYSNVTEGGSVILEIEKNRADIKWLCSDSVIRDSFTLFKSINGHYTFSIDSSKTAELSASWQGAYRWKHQPTLNTQTIFVTPANDSMYIVTDTLSCNADTFDIKVKKPIRIIDTILSVFHVEDNIGTVFPNPSENIIHVQFPNTPKSVQKITITNLQGQITEIKPEHIFATNNSLSLHLTSLRLPAGLYLLEIQFENSTSVKFKVYLK